MGAHDDAQARIHREAIRAWRRRFVAATLTGLTTSTLATACPCPKVMPSTDPPPRDGDEQPREDRPREDLPREEPPRDDGDTRDDGDPMEDADPYEAD